MKKKQFKGYEIWEDGTVIGKRLGKPLAAGVGTNGYKAVHLQLDGKEKRMSVHRLVASLFIPNPEDKPVVNHIDGDKTNNHVSNLEWCTHSENLNHAYESGIRKRGDNSEALKAHPQGERRKIAAMYKTGRYSYEHLGRLFGIGAGTVHRYVKEFEEGKNKIG